MDRWGWLGGWWSDGGDDRTKQNEVIVRPRKRRSTHVREYYGFGLHTTAVPNHPITPTSNLCRTRTATNGMLRKFIRGFADWL